LKTGFKTGIPVLSFYKTEIPVLYFGPVLHALGTVAKAKLFLI